jgi:hypothetical protein
MNEIPNPKNPTQVLSWQLPHIDRSEVPLVGCPAKPPLWKQISWRKYLNYLVPALLLITLLIYAFENARGAERRTETSNSPALEVVVSPVSIRKGERIPQQLLHSIGVAARDLSKNQKLKVLKAAQLHQISEELVAARDIAPFSPIFWNDLRLGNKKSARSIRTAILYSGEPRQ